MTDVSDRSLLLHVVLRVSDAKIKPTSTTSASREQCMLDLSECIYSSFYFNTQKVEFTNPQWRKKKPMTQLKLQKQNHFISSFMTYVLLSEFHSS